MIDSHCHINLAEFEHDRETVLKESFENGVRSLIVPAVDPRHFDSLRALSQSSLRLNSIGGTLQTIAPRNDRSSVYYSAGLHPWWVNEYIKSSPIGNNLAERLYNQLSQELNHPACVALGESGLHFKSTPKLTNKCATQFGDNELRYKIKHHQIKSDELASTQQQIEFLAVHFELAEKTKKALILHCVKSHQLLLTKIKQHPHSVRGVVHAFSGSYEQAKAFWDQGFYLGVGGVITYERAQKTRSAIKKMPLESLLLETDAPDMPLKGRQGQRNSPEYLAEVCRSLADLKGISFEDVQACTMRNTKLLFDLPF